MPDSPAKEIIESFQINLNESIARGEFANVSHLLSKLDAIQEQPQLTDPYIEQLIQPVLKVVLELPNAPVSQFVEDSYHVLYHYTKIRGAKIIGMHQLLIGDVAH